MGIGTLLYYILRIVKPYRWLLVVNIRLSMLIPREDRRPCGDG